MLKHEDVFNRHNYRVLPNSVCCLRTKQSCCVTILCRHRWRVVCFQVVFFRCNNLKMSSRLMDVAQAALSAISDARRDLSDADDFVSGVARTFNSPPVGRRRSRARRGLYLCHSMSFVILQKFRK